MTLYQFNSLDEMEQMEVIWNKAVKIAERQDEVNTYNLYQIDAFYIDEEIHTEWNVRRAFRTFASTNSALLQPYLELVERISSSR